MVLTPFISIIVEMNCKDIVFEIIPIIRFWNFLQQNTFKNVWCNKNRTKHSSVLLLTAFGSIFIASDVRNVP